MCGQQELFQTCLFILLQYQCNAALTHTHTHFFPPASVCVLFKSWKRAASVKRHWYRFKGLWPTVCTELNSAEDTWFLKKNRKQIVWVQYRAQSGQRWSDTLNGLKRMESTLCFSIYHQRCHWQLTFRGERRFEVKEGEVWVWVVSISRRPRPSPLPATAATTSACYFDFYTWSVWTTDTLRKKLWFDGNRKKLWD